MWRVDGGELVPASDGGDVCRPRYLEPTIIHNETAHAGAIPPSREALVLAPLDVAEMCEAEASTRLAICVAELQRLGPHWLLRDMMV